MGTKKAATKRMGTKKKWTPQEEADLKIEDTDVKGLYRTVHTFLSKAGNRACAYLEDNKIRSAGKN